MRIIKIKDMTKRFGYNLAIDKINLEIEEGEIFGLLGPNGAGKSTTINIISGLLKADKGSVQVFGKDMNTSAAEIKRNIGIVPQDIAIYEELTAYENVHFFAGLYGLRGKELKDRATEALQFTGLSDKAKSFPASFSGGMKRRLNIACAIAHKPRLIIMDEPTVGIDPQSRNHILNTVKELNKVGCTIIYTSHYMEEIEEICSRISIIDHGKVIAEGTKEELISIITNTNSVWITVNTTQKLNKELLEEINGVVSVEIEHNIVKINSFSDIPNLNDIIQYFVANKISVKNIENKKIDLETVFLTLTGRKLRD